MGCGGVCSTCSWYDFEKKIKEQIEKQGKEEAKEEPAGSKKSQKS